MPNRQPEWGVACDELADDPDRQEQAPESQGVRLQHRAEIDRGADGRKKDRHKEMAEAGRCLFDGMALLRLVENQSGGEGTDNHRRAGETGRGGQREGEGQRQRTGRSTDLKPGDGREEPRCDQPPDQQCHNQKAHRHAARSQGTRGGHDSALGEGRHDREDDQANDIVEYGRTEDGASFGAIEFAEVAEDARRDADGGSRQRRRTDHCRQHRQAERRRHGKAGGKRKHDADRTDSGGGRTDLEQ